VAENPGPWLKTEPLLTIIIIKFEPNTDECMVYSIRVFQIGVTDPKLCFDSEKVLSLAKTIRNRYENVHKAREAGIVS